MGWRSWLGVDLAGKLAKWKARYRGNVWTFDHRLVACHVTTWPNGTASVSATAYCNDPMAAEGVSTVARIYGARQFPTRIEAEAHLEAEIRNATRRHPDTEFYRERDRGDGVFIREVCKAGQWRQADHPPRFRRCQECGAVIEDAFCSRCGGLP